MSSGISVEERLKLIADSCVNPCAVLSVEKNDEGNCGDIRIVAANDCFSMTGEPVEGELYTRYLPKEPEFEDMCFRAAFNGERFHTYVDTTNMLGGWSENLIFPLKSDDENIGYCQFMYEVDQKMQPGKFSIVNPLIAGMVVQNCLTLRNGVDFKANLEKVMEDIRVFSDALSVCVVSLDSENEKAEILAQSVRSGSIAAEQLFSDVPYNIVTSWKDLIGESNCFIVRDKADLDRAAVYSPEWTKLLNAEDASSLCMVPLQQRRETIGYLLVTNFDVGKVTEIKETVELLALFLSSEMANNQFLKRLEWLTSIDLLTGAQNRTSMNRVVDELNARLQYNKIPFGVAICALNGLKALNAKEGHDAGNNVLAEAGEILRDVFDESNVYRSGGEEFSVVVENVSDDEFNKKIAILRRLGSDPDGVHFAIGSMTDSDTGDIRCALRTAHQKMNEEKTAFYDKYPDKNI